MVKVHIPIKLPSLLNSRMNWRKMLRLKKGQREETWYALREEVIPSPPLVVTITRYGPRQLDDDNLAASCKYVRDEIARKVGVDDGSTLYLWQYRQGIGKYGVDVEIRQRQA